MSDIKLIVNYINTQLQTNSFVGKPFQKGRFSGLAELVKKTGDEETNEFTTPIILDDTGADGTGVTINDKFPFELYHRITGQKTEDLESEENFGDGVEKLLTFEMALILFADRSIMEIEASEFITALSLDIPTNIKATSLSGAQFNNCSIIFDEINTNQSEVLTQEYGRKDLNIKQSYVTISFNYKIELIYAKGCFELC